MTRISTLVLVALAAAAIAAFGAGAATGSAAQGADLPQGAESVTLDPADFTTNIDNPYWPVVPGSRWVYREGEQRGTITVLRATRKIAGVEARVVHDVVRRGGRLVEDTYDWYAQDREGNVWYLGEDTKEYKDGRVSTTAGSWEHGVDGAYAGIIMPARPHDGLRYRQEYRKGEAEDRAEVLSLHEHATVPAGFFRGLVMTKDTTPLQPRTLEYKLYARGVGLVLVLSTARDAPREELVSYRRGGGQTTKR